MCLILKPNTRIHKTKKSKFFYKPLIPHNGNYIPYNYREFVYKKDIPTEIVKLKIENGRIKDIPTEIVKLKIENGRIYEGYHGYVNKRTSYGNTLILEKNCKIEIPPNTEYAYGINGEIVCGQCILREVYDG